MAAYGNKVDASFGQFQQQIAGQRNALAHHQTAELAKAIETGGELGVSKMEQAILQGELIVGVIE